MGELSLSVLEENESLIHSLLDCSCVNSEFEDEHCIIERLKELLCMRAGLVVSNNLFETMHINGEQSAKENSSFSFAKTAPWDKENKSWNYGCFDISENGGVAEANQSGMFSTDLSAYALLCEMLCEHSFDEINRESIKNYIDEMDDENFLYEDYYLDLCDSGDDDELEETVNIYRGMLLDAVIFLWDEIVKARKDGLSDTGELFALLNDYHHIFSEILTASDCLAHLEAIMHFTFGAYTGAYRELIVYANEDVPIFRKMADLIPDCYEKRLLEHAIELVSSTCELRSDEFPFIQFSGYNDTYFYTATAFISSCYGIPELCIRHPFWMLAMLLIDTLAPICVKKFSAGSAA